jgi:hypothetical protein
LVGNRSDTMNGGIRVTVTVAASAWLFLATGRAHGAPEGRTDFVSEVAPIIERHCVRCHQPAIKKGDLSLATRVDLDANDLLSAGHPDGSYLLAVVKTLRDWIAEGAPWPDGVALKEQSKADSNWWSLQPLHATEPPTADIPHDWAENPIDRFVYLKLAAANLKPNPPADRRTLVRRLTYDLTGLPPTPAEIETFLQDDSPNAYEKLVDRLLDSPRYGEQLGRQWLDVVRFGESTGFEVNHVIDNAWPYRDYVIRSFNEDKPFDRFIEEQIAGDSLAPDNPEVEIGLAFLVCGPVDIVGNADPVQAAQIRADGVDEMIRATGEAFLGLTIGCARCHDHKFDPLTQRDYYSLYATLAGVFHGDRVVASDERQRERADKLAALESQKMQLLKKKAVQDEQGETGQQLAKIDQQLAEVDQQIASLPAFPNLPVGRFEQPAAEQFVFERGDAQSKGERVVPASLSILENTTEGYELSADARERDRRLTLARWIVAADNPLTPRVMVNRLWQHHFGTGVVATPNDFGYMGERPSHPDLLDWLARRLVDEGWHLKPVQKLIVMSQAYRQASTFREDGAEVDSDSRLLWRFPPQRLGAEEIRDTMLYVAGKLDEQMGGPGFRLYQYSRDNVATYTPLDAFGPETYRRSIYHQNVRASRVDLLSDFDAPDCAFSVPRRVATTTPTQALVLMNHSFTLAMSTALAERLQDVAGAENMTDQVDLAFKLTFGRLPTNDETAKATILINRFGLPAFCRAMLNSSEMIYVN